MEQARFERRVYFVAWPLHRDPHACRVCACLCLLSLKHIYRAMQARHLWKGHNLNVVNPKEIVEEYGTDALRYFMLREVSSFEDSPFTLRLACNVRFPILRQ